MKQLELELNKRVLIVECDTEKASILNISGDFLPEYKKDFICKGSELTEEIVVNLVDTLPDFISAIEAQGYYWGKNPIKLIERGEDTERNRVLNQDQWREAESKTFNLEKTLIFEIL